MMLCVGHEDSNLNRASELYRQRFIDGRPPTEQRQLPSIGVFCTCQEDYIPPALFHAHPSTVDARQAELVLEYFEEEPTTTTKRAGTRFALPIQYTVSNQGTLQMIVNRYIYFLKHSNRDQTRQWRCIDYYGNLKCPALIFAKDDIVKQRIAAHKHPFHDEKILKKVWNNSIFTTFLDAEKESGIIKDGIIKSVKSKNGDA